MTRIHVVSLPHTLLTREYDWCAYTAKVRRFIGMLNAAGHQALVYGPEIASLDTGCADYITIVDEADRMEWFGRPEWDADQVFDRWDLADPCWTVTNERAAKAIRERWQEGDILALIGGLCQQQIIQELADLHPLTTEWGIGYSGIIEGTHKVFESYAWMHYCAARRASDDIAYFDAVIPNCFDPKDFLYEKKPGDYLLFIGRPNPRKGLPILAEIAKRSDYPLVIAGQPGADIPGADHVGIVRGTDKAKLLAGARALIAPTTYLEPFGGVAVEAMMSGTPAITTDYGAFTETVEPGVTGIRCRMLADFLHAAEDVEQLDRKLVRKRALERFSTDVGATLYDTYLNRLSTLHGEGWYAGT